MTEKQPAEAAANPKPLPRPAGLPLGLALALAASGGLAQTLAWPRFGLWPLTFLCLVPLWMAIHGQGFRRAFLFGWVYGLALGLSGFYWLAGVMAGYGGLGAAGGFLVLLLLAAFLALYQALWAGLMARFTVREAPLDGRLAGVPLLGACLWAGLDYLKNFVLTGFNWTPLAGGLAGSLEFVGAADLFGVYGLTLPVALISLFLAQAHKARARPGLALASAVAAVALAAALFGYGRHRLAELDREATQAPSPPRTLAIIQASVPQDHKWDIRFRDEILARFEALLERTGQSRPWLAIWPETAVPFLYALDLVETAWLDDLIGRHDFPMLVGLASGDYDEDGYLRLHNRAWLVEGQKVIGGYDKTHLVPFGEYVPLADVLPFLKWPFLQGLLGAAGTYSPGLRRPPMVLDGVQLGQMICFESIFPYMAYDLAKNGARLLVVTTNDAWFGLSMAPDQHLAHSVMRAVETRLPLARAANNGISALIAPSGRILERSVQNEVRSYVWPLRLPAQSPKTLFSRGGYLVAPAMGILAAIYALWRLVEGRFLANVNNLRRSDNPATLAPGTKNV
ncbi:MAG: apolipoprotein N-acyltransferase [Deltaproteobacteria bacterium]|jgi:apolipoprotein N-acyltransferase|nr:apolipoprotein N-acyltransferase [Deltaproteobacteria bacterium]